MGQEGDQLKSGPLDSAGEDISLCVYLMPHVGWTTVFLSCNLTFSRLDICL